MKNKTFFDSVKCALRGFGVGIKTEKNFPIYFGIAAVFFAVNLLCGISFTEHIVYFGICAGVFSAEFLNTAIEHLSNLITDNFDREIKLAKDIAAAGVLAWGLVFFGAEIAVVVRYFIS
ncbi:MAG: diacylglycerol kinase [Oscillospiraceae bacterium]